MPYWTLVNPMIIGNLDTTVKTNNVADAAGVLYERLSSNFNSTKHQPVLYFTVQKRVNRGDQLGGKSGTYVSFKAKEAVKNGNAHWKINLYNGKINTSRLVAMIDKVNNRAAESEVMEMQGGCEGVEEDTIIQEMMGGDHDSEIFDDIIEEVMDGEEKTTRNKSKKSRPYGPVDIISSPIMPGPFIADPLATTLFSTASLMNPIRYYNYSLLTYPDIELVPMPIIDMSRFVIYY